MKTEYIRVYKYGEYFNPAWDKVGDPRASVHCDRCKRKNLIACISQKRVDLCVQCISLIDDMFTRGDLNVNLLDSPSSDDSDSDSSSD